MPSQRYLVSLVRKIFSSSLCAGMVRKRVATSSSVAKHSAIPPFPSSRSRTPSTEPLFLASSCSLSLRPVFLAPNHMSRWRSHTSRTLACHEPSKSLVNPREPCNIYVHDPETDYPSIFRPFTAKYGERIAVVSPSPLPPAKCPDVPQPSGSVLIDLAPMPISPLSTADAAELLYLAQAHNKFQHADTARDLSVNAMARRLSAGETLPPEQGHGLLARLRYRARACCRASAIAHYLDWKPTQPVEAWSRPNGLEEMREAEKAGAAIASQFFSPAAEGVHLGKGAPVWRTMGPGAWLADAWLTAGQPKIEKNRWDAAVAFANRVADCKNVVCIPRL
ncbi:hypothetical protein B0H17DRAFT_1117199 [Mycena rosella]|uniref:Uncharacterized protein n=1 Tax=Mycena rosella TaxID=1033263 RepID=A0AAD7FDF4_MYCRO|nr:hypothetical protein B0H17DRAFT_1117199 [Mycena rosella]